MNIEKRTMTLLKISILTFITLAATYYYQAYIFNGVGYYTRWIPCLDFIKEGVLYAGQPYCESGGPPLFFIPYVIREIVGANAFQWTMIFFSTILHGIILWLLLKMLKKEVPSQDFFLPSLLYIFLIYLPTTTRFEATIALLFFISGYYFLYDTPNNKRHIWGGILFGLSILSKPSAVVPIGIAIIALLFRDKIITIENKKIEVKIKKENVYHLLWLASPTALFILYFKLKYKFFFIYYVFVMMNQEEAISYVDAVRSILILDVNKMNPMVIPLIATILLSFYVLYTERKSYAWIAGPAQLILFIMIVKSFGINHLAYHYWTLAAPFFIICICLLYQKARDEKKRLITIACNTTLALILIFPGLYMNPLTFNNNYMKFTSFEKQRLEFIRQLHYPYQIIPSQKRALFEQSNEGAKRFFYEYNVKIPIANVDLLTRENSQGTPDAFSFYRYRELLGENLIYNPDNESLLSDDEKRIIGKIERGEYSFIHLGPPEWVATNRALANAGKLNALNYCSVMVPSNVWLTREGLHEARFIFKKKEDCQEVFNKMYKYYQEHFKEICKKDKFSADMIKLVVEKNGVPLQQDCPQGGAMMLYFKKTDVYNKYLTLFIIIFMMAAISIQYFLLKKNFQQKENRRMQRVLILGVLIIAVAYWSLKIALRI